MNGFGRLRVGVSRTAYFTLSYLLSPKHRISPTFHPPIRAIRRSSRLGGSACTFIG
ncbi:hypothetical protein PVAP13_2NG377903 [Panicum virgatum]|uniref:Uncharacterized protein n=1 Tax=Panicum virgatum TaxID=38727 RepID=A0A8T0VM42_PANVG|nr:hypothetical protein PVAP13_2NG377903 [Panicum virgatum]